jgi:hypothetical protein
VRATKRFLEKSAPKRAFFEKKLGKKLDALFIKEQRVQN